MEEKYITYECWSFDCGGRIYLEYYFIIQCSINIPGMRLSD